MAGRSSRNKGAAGEREVLALLQPIVDEVCRDCGQPRLEIRRNYSQRYQEKEYDLIGVPWIAVEVKRVENLSGIGSWWRQTLAATREGQVPCLFYRQNYGQWKVRTRLPVNVGNGKQVRMTMTLSLDSWLVWFKELLKWRLG